MGNGKTICCSSMNINTAKIVLFIFPNREITREVSAGILPVLFFYLWAEISTMRILLLNGPNLNLLGKREPEIYGSETFEDILLGLRQEFPGMELDYFQSNHEGAIIDRIQASLKEDLGGMVVNMGAFTHYSYAILDALRMVKAPVVEVHLSHLHQRESFRHTSVIAPACVGMITGFGKHGYHMALDWLLNNAI